MHVATILLAGVDLFFRGKLEALLPGHHLVTADTAEHPDLVANALIALGAIPTGAAQKHLHAVAVTYGPGLIGSLLGAASLVPIYNAPLAFINPAVIVVLILIVPLFDTGFVLMLRRLAGLKATKGGTDHVSHRLVSLGFSERSAVRILYLLGIAGGATAWVLVQGQGIEPMLPLVAAFTVVITLIGIYLARVPAYNAEDFVALQKSSFAPFLKDLAFRWHAAEVLLDLLTRDVGGDVARQHDQVRP